MEKISSRKNPLCVHMKRLGEDRRYRYETGLFLCDGRKLLEEAAGCDAEVSQVLTAVDIPFPLSVDTRVYHTDRLLINSISPLRNAQEVLFTCKMPSGRLVSAVPDANAGAGFPAIALHEDSAARRGNEVYVLLDGLQDPGNVGTIIRTALAFGIDGVILTPGCADVYNPKTIRATMGAIFKQSLYTMGIEELRLLRGSGARFIAASPAGGGTAPDCGELRVKNRAAEQPAMTENNAAENNAAGNRAAESNTAGNRAADNNTAGNRAADNNTAEQPAMTENNAARNRAAGGGTVIAIGSEGRGLSGEVISLCEQIVTIPVSPLCESLNAAVAAAILIWEAKKKSLLS